MNVAEKSLKGTRKGLKGLKSTTRRSGRIEELKRWWLAGPAKSLPQEDELIGRTYDELQHNYSILELAW